MMMMMMMMKIMVKTRLGQKQLMIMIIMIVIVRYDLTENDDFDREEIATYEEVPNIITDLN